MLKAQVQQAGTAQQLEDVYLPHRPKRTTKGVALVLCPTSAQAGKGPCATY